MKNKANINFIIDAVMFINMMAMAGIGFLIKYTLVPGYRENELYGRSVDLSFWNMDRHEWGRIHLMLSLFFIFLLILHIVLHWNVILRLYKKTFRRKTGRTVLTPVFLIASFGLILFSFLVKPSLDPVVTASGRILTGETTEIPDRMQEHSEESIMNHENLLPEAGRETEIEHETIYAVNGSMTIGQVSTRYGVPVSYIQQQLNIQENIPDNTRLGHLRRRYGFTMHKVEEIIEKYRNNQ